MNTQIDCEQWQIGRVKPYKKNAKLHPPEQVTFLSKLIEKHGFDQPIVVDKRGVIIKGHGRWLAAKKLNLVTVPVVVKDWVTAEQADEERLADNRVSEYGWDYELLNLELRRLSALPGFDIALTGFPLDKFEALPPEIAESGVVTREEFPPVFQDEVPAVPKKATTKLGDIWLLGGHRLVCGDSTNKQTALVAIGSTKPFIMVTDPPYGVEYDPEARAKSRGNAQKIHSTGKVLNDDRADWEDSYKHFPGDVAYVWCASLFSPVVYANLVACGFDLRSQIIWAKQQLVFGRGHYHWQHEPCWYGVRQGAQAAWSGDRKQTTLWQIENKIANQDDMNTTHGTQKPVECMVKPMRNHGQAGAVVYDPFLGSGTSVIAAEQSSRVCVGLELSPNYCDLIVERWQNFTGKKAKRG